MDHSGRNRNAVPNIEQDAATAAVSVASYNVVAREEYFKVSYCFVQPRLAKGYDIRVI